MNKSSEDIAITCVLALTFLALCIMIWRYVL